MNHVNMDPKPRSPVFVMNDKFKELIERRDRADEMLLALMDHPRFWETGDGIFQVNEIKIRVYEEMCAFITAARAKYPMCHFLWNHKEFDRYEQVKE